MSNKRKFAPLEGERPAPGAPLAHGDVVLLVEGRWQSLRLLGHLNLQPEAG